MLLYFFFVFAQSVDNCIIGFCCYFPSSYLGTQSQRNVLIQQILFYLSLYFFLFSSISLSLGSMDSLSLSFSHPRIHRLLHVKSEQIMKKREWICVLWYETVFPSAQFQHLQSYASLNSCHIHLQSCNQHCSQICSLDLQLFAKKESVSFFD